MSLIMLAFIYLFISVQVEFVMAIRGRVVASLAAVSAYSLPLMPMSLNFDFRSMFTADR